jgi:hypothetical protein
MELKRNYHYLVAGLPDLLLDETRSKLSLVQLANELKPGLHPNDIKLVDLLFLQHDNDNLLNLLQKNDFEFDTRGIYAQDVLEEQIKEQDGTLPQYMNSFIEEFKTGQIENPELTWEIVLERYFYAYLTTSGNDFVRDWFTYRMNKKNVITALICRQHDLVMEHQLIGESDFTEALMRSNARDFGLSNEFEELEKILSAWESQSLLAREKALDNIDWQWIEEHTFFHYFTIEKVIGFLLMYAMVERWMKLDKAEGEKLFNKFLEALGKSFVLPDEFNIQTIKRK